NSTVPSASATWVPSSTGSDRTTPVTFWPDSKPRPVTVTALSSPSVISVGSTVTVTSGLGSSTTVAPAGRDFRPPFAWNTSSLSPTFAAGSSFTSYLPSAPTAAVPSSLPDSARTSTVAPASPPPVTVAP